MYLLYSSLAEKYVTVFPSIRSLSLQTGFSLTSIVKYNKILEEVGLLEIKRNNLNNSNHYILTDPPEFTDSLKKKMNLHEDFEPILNPFPVFQKVEHRCSRKWNTGVPESETPVFQKMDHNNKDLVVVFNSLKTTTIPERTCALLSSILDLPASNAELIKSSDSILKSAVKYVSDPEDVFLFIQEKCKTFKKQILKADDKIAYIHNAVAKNLKPTATIKREVEDQTNSEITKAQEDDRKRIEDAWRKLSSTEKAKYFSEHIKKYSRVKNQSFSEEDLAEALNTLATTGRFGNFQIEKPPIDFKAEKGEA